MLRAGIYCSLMLLTAAASAQSQLTLYGVIDAGLIYNTHQAAGDGSRFSVESGALQVSRWGLRGSEQIDPDIRILFSLESTLNHDTGSAGAGFGGNQFSQNGTSTSLFDRAAWLGVSGRYGTLTAGRQNILGVESVGRADPADLAHAATNPNVLLSGMYAGALYGGFGSNRGGAALRQNNALKYVSPAVEGSGFALMYAPGEQAGSVRSSSYAGVSAYYSTGRDGVAAAYGVFRDQTGTASLEAWATGVKWRPSEQWTVRASFAGDLVRGDITIPMPGNPQANANGRRITVGGIGVDYQHFPALVSTVAAYQSRRSGDVPGRAAQYLVITKYSLSGRTVLYGSLTFAVAASPAPQDTMLALGIIGVGSGYRSAWRAASGIQHVF